MAPGGPGTTVANSGTSNGSPAAAVNIAENIFGKSKHICLRQGFLGWGASPGAGAGAEQGAGQSQQTTPPQHGQAAAAAAAAGTWSNQPRDRQGEQTADTV